MPLLSTFGNVFSLLSGMQRRLLSTFGNVFSLLSGSLSEG